MNSKARRLLVTGGDSFTAGHLLPYLEQSRAFETVAVSGRHPRDTEESCYHSADLTDPRQVSPMVQSTAPNAVIHLAGSRGDDECCWSVNLDATRSLLEACACQPEPPDVMLVSSAAVYGSSGDGNLPVNESAPLRPLNAYGASKAEAELVAMTMHRQGRLRVVVVRPFNLLGPGLRPGTAPADFTAQIKAIREEGTPSVMRVGNLDTARDFIDVRDAVRAYTELICSEDGWGRAFNVSSGQSVTIGGLLEQMLDCAGLEEWPRIIEQKTEFVEVTRQSGDPSALRELTGWSADIPLARSLADMLAWTSPDRHHPTGTQST